MSVKRGPQKYRKKGQIQILYKLATDGSNSISGLSRLLKTHRSNIQSAMKVLKEIKYVKRIDKKFGRGSPENIFQITDKGLEYLSKEPQITLEQFWNIVFLIDAGKTIETRIPLKKIFENYEKNVLGFNLDKVSFLWGFSFDYLFELNRWPIKLDMQIFILYIIGVSKKIEHKKLLNRIKRRYKVQNKVIDDLIKKLIYSKLIQSKQDSTNYYQLSVMGFVLVINYFDSVFLHKEKPEKIIDYDKDLKTIMDNSKEIVPLISKICSEISYLITSKVILNHFRFIYKRTLPILVPIQYGGTKEIVFFSRIMNQVRREKIVEYYYAGFSSWKNLLDQNKIKEKDSEAVNKMKYLAHISGFKTEREDEITQSVKGTDFSLDKIIEDSLVERITLEFLCYLLFEINQWKKADVGFKIKNQHDNWAGKLVEKWENLIENNPQVTDFFNSKIKEIKEFEKKNLEMLETSNLL